MATYYQEFRHRAQLNLGLTLLVLGFCLSVIYFIMTREVAAPLASLATAAQAAGRGDWDAASSGIEAAHAAAGKEIAELATVLDGMTGEIRASQTALEERVEQRTRQLREANQELTRARQFQADFLAAVSHDLRTPLTSVIAQAEILLDQDMGRLTPAQEEFLRDILGSGRDLVTMINDLLDLAKIEAGKSELSPEDCDPADLISEVVGSVVPLAERAGLTVESRSGDLPVVRWDRQKVRRVLLNLLSNAIKFTPAGGRVRVVAQKAELHGHPAVRIDVIDTGVGIAPEDQVAVFEAYRQVGRAAKGTMGGTGLGLPLARQLVELHGGVLSLQSQLGQGSAFTVLLPVASAKGEAV
ncbi:MAG: ATP-binding protein [Bacillota bacterium]